MCRPCAWPRARSPIIPTVFGRRQAYLTYLKRKNLELQERGKRMEVATHFIHPDEISPQSLSIITELVQKRHCGLCPNALFKRLQ